MSSVDTSDIAVVLKELDSVDICTVPEILDADESVSLGDSPTATVLIHQYEQVVVKSLITSFGLDGILFHDRAGGDVDTLVTVRTDGIGYADKTNEEAYNNRGDYDKHAKYAAHGGDPRYRAINSGFSAAKKAGKLYDAYTGQKFARNANINLEHVISAKEAHDDPARVLAELSTEDLVNTTSNLVPIEETVNKSKKEKSVTDYLAWLDSKKEFRQNRIQELSNRSELSDKERKELHKLKQQDIVDGRRVMARDRASRAAYERRLAVTYYTSPKFLKSTAGAALSSGAKMGVRQALGLLLTEVWCAVREEFPKIVERMKGNFELGKFLSGIAEAFKKAFQSVKEKFKALIASFKDGALSGILASITTTVINMFTATAKNIGRILRETWSSLLEAFKILFLNPDDLSWGERLRAAAKVIAVAVSVIAGGLVQEWVSKFTASLPLGDVISVFVGSLVSGILSVSFVYFLDHSEIIKKLTAFLDSLFTNEFRHTVEFFKEVNMKLDRYLAELAQIDYAAFAREIVSFREINARFFAVKDERELNSVLHAIVRERGISLPYEDLAGLDRFMMDRNAVLVV